MRQEVQVTVMLTIDVDAELDKKTIQEDVEKTIGTVFTRLSTPLKGWLSAYNGHHVILNTTQAKVIEVKEESEIYGNE